MLTMRATPRVPARQSGLPQRDSTFGHRPYRAAGTNAALGLALSHRREARNAIAARRRPAASMIASSNCDSHNYLLGAPKPENTDSYIKRFRIENILKHGAGVSNIGC